MQWNFLMVVEAHRVIRFFCHNSVAILLRARKVGSRVPVTGRLLLKGRDFPRDNSFTPARRHRPSSPRVPLENVEFNDVRGTSSHFFYLFPPPITQYIYRMINQNLSIFIPFFLLIINLLRFWFFFFFIY